MNAVEELEALTTWLFIFPESSFQLYLKFPALYLKVRSLLLFVCPYGCPYLIFVVVVVLFSCCGCVVVAVVLVLLTFVIVVVCCWSFVRLITL